MSDQSKSNMKLEYERGLTAWTGGLQVVKHILAALAIAICAANVPAAAQIQQAQLLMTSPANNSNYSAPASITLTASFDELFVDRVEYYNDRVLIGTATTAPYTVTWTNVPAGNYSIHAEVFYAVDAWAVSAPVVVSVVGNAAPVVSLAATPTSEAAPATISIAATATDADGSIAKVEFFSDGNLLATVTQAPFTFVWTNVAAGTYAVTARATDNLGSATTSVPTQVAVAAAAGQAYYVYSDQVNTVREITNAAGTVVWRADNSEPFGVNVPNENPSGLGQFTYNPRFPGQYYDRETGLHYNYYRDYDPSTGRYVESDPIGLGGGINTYSYVCDNPITRIDPAGLDWLSPDGQPIGSGCGDAGTDRKIPDSFGTFSFLGACRRHDICYGTCGKSKELCDKNFYDDMKSECDKLPWYMRSKRNCNFAASAYVTAVAVKGGDAYRNAQKKACKDCAK